MSTTQQIATALGREYRRLDQEWLAHARQRQGDPVLVKGDAAAARIAAQRQQTERIATLLLGEERPHIARSFEAWRAFYRAADGEEG